MDPRNRVAADKLDAEVKARIRPKQKRALERIARRREMHVSDVMREAFRLYLDKNRQEKAQLEPANV